MTGGLEGCGWGCRAGWVGRDWAQLPGGQPAGAVYMFGFFLMCPQMGGRMGVQLGVTGGGR